QNPQLVSRTFFEIISCRIDLFGKSAVHDPDFSGNLRAGGSVLCGEDIMGADVHIPQRTGSAAAPPGGIRKEDLAGACPARRPSDSREAGRGMESQIKGIAH
ncbi:hypothetical protein, partial [Methanoregula sp.]|uniref:hypothetical protein n=1 Tax=Methanoregula sp. TaxID=2052170 RepID=UPI003BAF3A50